MVFGQIVANGDIACRSDHQNPVKCIGLPAAGGPQGGVNFVILYDFVGARIVAADTAVVDFDIVMADEDAAARADLYAEITAVNSCDRAVGIHAAKAVPDLGVAAIDGDTAIGDCQALDDDTCPAGGKLGGCG